MLDICALTLLYIPLCESVSCSVPSNSLQLMDCSPPGSSVHGILQARIPFPSPRDLPNPGNEPGSPALQTDSLPAEPPGKPIFCYTALLNIRTALSLLLKRIALPLKFYFGSMLVHPYFHFNPIFMTSPHAVNLGSLGIDFPSITKAKST